MLIFLSIIYFLTLFYLIYLSIKKENSLLRFVIKTINCGLFIVIFIINSYVTKIDNNLFIPLLIAFILSFIGDLGLGYYHVNKNKIFKGIGFIGFCLAQVTFIFSFIYNFGYNLYLLFIPFLGVILGLYFVYRLKINEKGIYLMSFIYMNLVCMMLSSSISTFITLRNSFSLMLLMGGLLFSISDYTLLFKYYSKKFKTQITFISVLTYGVAQFLFATSIILL